ncbi:replication protein RepA [Xanthomonas campestris pv. campestris]|nr:replication protein RepA [Xanthomonas campestris pv. campestris]
MAEQEFTASAAAKHSGVSPVSKRNQMLLDAYYMIEQEDARAAGTVGYMGRILVQATLPHKDPKLPPGQMYSRTTGLATLNIVPTSRKYGIPFGTLPRILLAWICTEAVRTQCHTLELGRSQAEFMKKLQLHGGGSDVARFREQAMRLFRSLISIDRDDDDRDEADRLMVSDQDKIFWHKDPNVQSLWQSELKLTDKFFKEVTNRPVPLDLRVMHALSKAPLSMDIYTWLTYRMFVLRSTGRRSVDIPWVGLVDQIGAGYANTAEGLRAFRYYFRERLKEVLLFYPDAAKHVEDTGTCLRITPAPLHLPAHNPLR